MNKTNLSASYDVDLAKKVGIVAAALFNKLVYLTQYTDREDGYCWRTAEEFEKELGISRKQQEGAIKKLEEAGLIITKNTYIKNTQIKCKHFKVLIDCAKRENLISTKGKNQDSTKGTNQISTKDEVLSFKDNNKEYSDSNNQTEKEVVPGIEKLIDDFCKEKGNDKTKELFLNFLENRRAKGTKDTEGSVKSNLELLPTKAKQSNMSINEYLIHVVGKGWKQLYVIGEEKHSFRMMTGAEAGITWEPDAKTATPSSNETEEDSSIPDDILDMLGEDGNNDS
jgi:hypothetical protein